MSDKHFYTFLGIDPAPSETAKADEGGLVVGVATPAVKLKPRDPLPLEVSDWYFDLVYARRLTSKHQASARQYSGVIHGLEQQFHFERICMDPQQGGSFVKRELINERQTILGQEVKVLPIADLEEGPKRVIHAKFNLTMFRPRDPGIERLWPDTGDMGVLNDNMYASFKVALDSGQVAMPPPVDVWMRNNPDEFMKWPDEKQWAMRNLTLLQKQLVRVEVVTDEDGVTELRTRKGARKFQATGKKDLVSAAMYAWVAFLVWLKMGEFEMELDPADAPRFGGCE